MPPVAADTGLWDALLTGVALLLVIEGMLPFAAPQRWREAVRRLAELPDAGLRAAGLGSMLLGVLLLYWLH